MTRLLHRIPGRRAERDEELPAPPPAATPPEADALRTTVRPDGAAAAAPAAPAAADPDAADRPSFRERGRLRRRLRYLRRVRELAFRDLGGLVFDQHRFDRRDPALLEGKIRALGAVDRELRVIERALRDERPMTELREAGLSTCGRCGALMGSEMRFCPTCGLPAGAGPEPQPFEARSAEPAREAPQPTELLRTDPAEEPAAEPKPGHRADAPPDQPTTVSAPSDGP